MKSLMASMSCTHCCFDRSSCEKRRKFSSDSAAWLVSACSNFFSSFTISGRAPCTRMAPSASPSLPLRHHHQFGLFRSRTLPHVHDRNLFPAAGVICLSRDLFRIHWNFRGAFQLDIISANQQNRAPIRAEHSGHAFGKPLQEFRQVPRLRGFRGQFHQFGGALQSGERPVARRNRRRRIGRRYFFCSSHNKNQEAVLLPMNESTHFHANRQSQCESISDRCTVVHHATLPVRRYRFESQRETQSL